MDAKTGFYVAVVQSSHGLLSKAVEPHFNKGASAVLVLERYADLMQLVLSDESAKLLGGASLLRERLALYGLSMTLSAKHIVFQGRKNARSLERWRKLLAHWAEEHAASGSGRVWDVAFRRS